MMKYDSRRWWIAPVLAMLLFVPPAMAAEGDGAAVSADNGAAANEDGHVMPRTEVEAGEVTEEPGEFCGICESKRRFNELIPGFEMGFDHRYRMIYDYNVTSLDQYSTGHQRYWHRNRSRMWARVTPMENLDINARLVIEPRYYCQPTSMADQSIRTEALWDKLNVEWRQAFGLPLTIKAGRQDMRLGSGYLVFEGTPLDGSRTIFFDAIRATWDAQEIQTVFDLVVLNNHANSAAIVAPYCDDDADLIEDDETGVIVYASNKSIQDTTIDGYFIYKHTDKPTGKDNSASNPFRGFDADIYTFGARVAGKMGPNWQYSAEAAPQFGHKEGAELRELAVNTKLAYLFHDPMNTDVHCGYEFRSGDEDHINGGFDMLWGRYPQWSNIYNGYLDGLEGRIAMSNNIHRVNVGVGFEPAEDMSITADYHAIFREEDETGVLTSTGFAGNCTKGHLFTALWKWRLDEHWSTHMVGEAFVPDDYYSDARNDTAFFLRWELAFSW